MGFESGVESDADLVSSGRAVLLGAVKRRGLGVWWLCGSRLGGGEVRSALLSRLVRRRG